MYASHRRSGVGRRLSHDLVVVLGSMSSASTAVRGTARPPEGGETVLSGLPVDDPLAALGKSRKDASIVIGWDASGSGIVAFGVSGVEGAALAQTVSETWLCAAVIGHSEAVVGGKEVCVLEIRGGRRVYLYYKGDAVYVIETATAAFTEEALGSLP